MKPINIKRKNKMENYTACLLLADGFEETEAIMTADVLKRIGINIMFVGVNNKTVRGTHDFCITADKLINDISVDEFNALVLPGGLPGTINLRNSQAVINLIKKAYDNKKICAAICAAPIVLRDAGITNNKNITGYPGCEQLSLSPDFQFSGKDVEIDDLIITAKGMGKSAQFAFEIAKALGFKQSEIQKVADSAFIS
jgi:4-methyl-5(b-hydroxyethyl)-thiazole monophosphate biosynthesis